jgi:uncharacterized protein
MGLKAARRLWLHAQKLDELAPFGDGPDATRRAVEHLGYVQIDTINVIERSHHHILFSRIPAYRRDDLRRAQSIDRTVFEFWTHALAYVPLRDFGYFVPQMKAHRKQPFRWYADVTDAEANSIVRRVRREGAISIRDIEDDVLVDKDHPWASRKPSKRALQRAFFDGRLVVSARDGMVKSYDLIERHFTGMTLPRPATTRQVDAYLLDRALTAHGIINGAAVMHPWQRFSPGIADLVASRARRKQLIEVRLEGDKLPYYVAPESMEPLPDMPPLVHILSPFDPLIIQRRRLKLFFGYDHLFEAYVTREKRKYGYFTLPVLFGDEIVAGLDLKTDRAKGKLLIQSWHWFGTGKARTHKRAIEEALHRFEAFQIAP